MPYTIINGQIVPVNEPVVQSSTPVAASTALSAPAFTPESLPDYDEFSGEDVEGLAPDLYVEGTPLPPKPKRKDDLSDLFEVPKRHDHDMQTDDLVALKEEDVTGGDMHDLFDVDFDRDIWGGKPKKKAERSMQRTSKVRPSVFPSLGGTR